MAKKKIVYRTKSAAKKHYRHHAKGIGAIGKVITVGLVGAGHQVIAPAVAAKIPYGTAVYDGGVTVAGFMTKRNAIGKTVMIASGAFLAADLVQIAAAMMQPGAAASNGVTVYS